MKPTIINVMEIIEKDAQVPTVFYGENEEMVIQAAEKHFSELLKSNCGMLMEGEEWDDFLAEALDNGYYDDDNGYQLVISWPVRTHVLNNGEVEKDGE